MLYLKGNTCISCWCRLHYHSSTTVPKLVCRMDDNPYLTPKDIRKESFQCARHLLAVHCFRGYLDEVHEASQGQGRQLGGICGWQQHGSSSTAPGQFLWYSGSIKSIDLHIKHLKPEHPDSTHIVSLASVSQLFTSTVVSFTCHLQISLSKQCLAERPWSHCKPSNEISFYVGSLFSQGFLLLKNGT